MPTLLRTTALLAVVVAARSVHAADPHATIAQSEQVLAELIAIPGKQIPAKLLAEAQGIAIVPRVIKIGFVAGGRRGHGVVLVRDAQGAWSLPQFVQLTGGSVGWQAGVSGTDVVLIFRTQASVQNLMKGKFTVGVDAAAAAGPAGRNAAAATDTRLQAEILSYSRSRGLFLGAAIDGSVIEADPTANAAFYGSPTVQTATIVPPSATHLQAYVATLTSAGVVPPTVAADPNAAPDPLLSPEAGALRLEALKRSLVVESARLAELLDAQWRAYFALPPSLADAAAPPDQLALSDLYARFEQVAADPQYASLAGRPEFQGTFELLREYIAASNASSSALQLPAPPPTAGNRR
jgi:lipid-binding SYLF domain-containing protein